MIMIIDRSIDWMVCNATLNLNHCLSFISSKTLKIIYTTKMMMTIVMMMMILKEKKRHPMSFSNNEAISH